MKARPRTLRQILRGAKQFHIPIYQRPYAWNQENQWELLWEDIENTARNLLRARIKAHADNIPPASADEKAPPHFLGAIVLEQIRTQTGEVDARLVVDGQQRLTTLHLLLRGTLDALAAVDAPKNLQTRVRKLIFNDEDEVDGHALHKVLPRRADRGSYTAALRAPTPPSDGASQFGAARHYFSKMAHGFLDDDEIAPDPYSNQKIAPAYQRASILVATLLDLVKLVVIDLDDVDDAQVIFEALNARGTPLSATDLVKNLLFMRAQLPPGELEERYPSLWGRFDDERDWWSTPVGTGHAQRTRQDWLLGHWLIAQTGHTVSVGRLYGSFRDWFIKGEAAAIATLETLNRYADAYEMLYERREGASETEIAAFRCIRRLNITAATPVLLWLLTRSAIDQRERETVFRAIEVFVVRRMLVKWQTRGYNQLFADVLSAAKATEHGQGWAVIEALRDKGCPNDRTLAWYFENERYYGPGGINRARLRLILGAVDRGLQSGSHKGEPVKIEYDKLQIEHILPQDWRETWPVTPMPQQSRVALEQEREGYVHRIGNLTLVSDRLNPAMGNSPWLAKRSELQKHTHLRLNAELLQEDGWGEDEIARRGRWLAARVALEWPALDDRSWSDQPGSA